MRTTHLIWRGATRLEVVAVVLGILVVLLAIGSTRPQPGTDAVRFFGAPWMLIPWALLLAATLLCTLHRWRGIWYAERPGLARLATLVTHLAVLLLLAGVLINTQFGWRSELTVPPGAAVEVGHASGLRIANAGFRIERYLDGTIADYVAELQVQNAPVELRLNAPVVRDGVGFYLRGYQVLPEGAALTVLAAYDPGYTLIVLAGFLLFAGLTVTFVLGGGLPPVPLANARGTDPGQGC
jgi:hypothetical protein